MPPDVIIRPARPEDETDDLLYRSASPYYDVYAGDERRARRILRAVWPRPEHNASYAVSRVALGRDGRVVGIVAAFPVEQGERLAGRFVMITVPRIPPWRWPSVFAHLRAAGRLAPQHPQRSWYIDALAVDPSVRRQGIATALLRDALDQARYRSLTGVALDTGLRNSGARALYERVGFQRGETRHAEDERTERAIGGPGFVSYFLST